MMTNLEGVQKTVVFFWETNVLFAKKTELFCLCSYYDCCYY